MKSEELFRVLTAWFIGMLGIFADIIFNKQFSPDEFRFTWYGLFALIFFGFAVYFLVKYTGLLDLFIRRKIRKNETKN